MNLLSAIVLALVAWQVTAADAGQKESRRRNPVAIIAAGNEVFVANRGGTLSILDARTHKVMDEIEVGKQLADLIAVPAGPYLLAVDEGGHAVVLLQREAGRAKVVARHRVPHSPVSVSLNRAGDRLTIASLWARQLTILRLQAKPGIAPRFQHQAVVDLPFAPRLQWPAPDNQRLVVADSFAGHLGVIDLRLAKLFAVRRIPGHNIRGLSTSGGGARLMISHQAINGLVPTQRERVFWGSVVSNVVREVELKELLALVDAEDIEDGAADIAHWRLHPLGRPGSATGDPGDVIVTKAGKTVVLLSGINQLAISAGRSQPFTRLAVGRRPVDMALNQSQSLIYIANMFDDSVSVFDLRQMKIVATISLGASARLKDVELGERLFYDAKLSLDGWYSCHSCHTDGHTNGSLNDNFGDGSFGAPKRILSLLGVRDTAPWAWTGERKSLSRQVHKSILETMRGKKAQASATNVAHLTAYLRSLDPPPSISKARGRVDRARVARGRRVFVKRECKDCHQAGAYTSARVYDVGLKDELGRKTFNPPSLRGVSQRDSYLHDGRAARLEEVFQSYRHPHGEAIPAAELADLLAFLRSL